MCICIICHTFFRLCVNSPKFVVHTVKNIAKDNYCFLKLFGAYLVLTGLGEQ